MSDSNQDRKIMGTGEAILWFLLCLPIGFMQMGQPVKGWAWVGISFLTGGLAGFVAMIDYFICFGVQQKRPLGEWEFFPK